MSTPAARSLLSGVLITTLLLGGEVLFASPTRAAGVSSSNTEIRTARRCAVAGAVARSGSGFVRCVGGRWRVAARPTDTDRCLPAAKGQIYATAPRLVCDGARWRVPVTAPSAPPPPPIDATVTTAALRSPREPAPIGANERPCDAVWADVSSLVPTSWVAYAALPTATRFGGAVDRCELQFFPFGHPYSKGYIAVRAGRACTTQPCESAGVPGMRTLRRSDGLEITIYASRATLSIPVPAALDELLAVLTDVPLPRVRASVIP